MPIVLTKGQEAALGKIYSFLADPNETVFVLKGYSGTGKSTLVKHFFEKLPDYIRTLKLLVPNMPEWQVELTATTNKAAEALQSISNRDVKTIQSFLGLRVHTNYETKETYLISKDHTVQYGLLLFIDEASFINQELLQWIFKLTDRCKIVFMGDPAQLLSPKVIKPPVFNAGFTEAELTEVVRTGDNQIRELSTAFRETVTTGIFPKFKPNGKDIIHLPEKEFYLAINDEFNRPDWKYQDSKILAWRNDRVIWYNHAVRDAVKGDPNFEVGDYAVCNKYLKHRAKSIKTDELVHITGISELTERFGVPGYYYMLNYTLNVFGPRSLAEKNKYLAQCRKVNAYKQIQEIEDGWVDLRAAYAQTVNKSQGSTYGKVFIDLDDLSDCRNRNTLARLMYVGISRASQQVYLKGDFA